LEKNLKTTMLKPVFIPSVIVLVLLVLYTITMPENAASVFDSMKNWIAQTFGWFYMLSVGIFTLFVLFLAVSPYGRFKLYNVPLCQDQF